MTNKCGWTRQRTNNLRDKLIWGINSASELATVYYYTRRGIRGGRQSTLPGEKAWCIIAPIERYSGYRHFNEKRKSCNHRCPDSVYFHKLFLIIFLSAIERLICRREMSLIGPTSFDFAQKYDTWFSKYHIELIVALSSTNAKKIVWKVENACYQHFILFQPCLRSFFLGLLKLMREIM